MANDDEIATASKKVKRALPSPEPDHAADLSKLALGSSEHVVVPQPADASAKGPDDEEASALEQLRLQDDPEQGAGPDQMHACSGDQHDSMPHDRDSPEHPLARLHLSGKRSQPRASQAGDGQQVEDPPPAHTQPGDAAPTSPSCSDQPEEQQNKKLRPTALAASSTPWPDRVQPGSQSSALPNSGPPSSLNTTWPSRPPSHNATSLDAAALAQAAAGIQDGSDQAVDPGCSIADAGTIVGITTTTISTAAAAVSTQQEPDQLAELSNIDQLLQLIRGHPDSDAAVAAAMRAVQRLKRSAPSTTAQPSGSAKRAATHNPTDGRPSDAGGSADGTGGAGGAQDVGSLVGRLEGDTTPAKKKAGVTEQLVAVRGATDIASGTEGGVAGDVAGGQQGVDNQTAAPVQGKQKKARSKATGDSSAAAVASPSPAAAGSGGGGGGEGEGGLPVAVVPAAPVPDMQTYLDTFPACKHLVEHVRMMPNNSTKTPLALVNEYAARLTLEVVWGEEGDTAAGPYTATCSLQNRVSGVQHASGTGRGRNKRDARQVAAAACMEALLGPNTGLQPADFLPSAKPVTQPANKRDSRPGLGFPSNGGGPGGGGSGSRWQAGNKKRRDDGGGAGGGMSVGGGLQGAASSRPVSFTRAVLPSSLGSSYNRSQPEVLYPASARDGPGVRPGSGVGHTGGVGGRAGGGPPGPGRHSLTPGSIRPMPPHPEAPGGYVDAGWRHGGAGGGPHIRGVRAGHTGGSEYGLAAHAIPGQGIGDGQPGSAFGMHSLQAILPAAGIDGGLGKREKRDFATAMTATGGVGAGGLLGLPGWSDGVGGQQEYHHGGHGGALGGYQQPLGSVDPTHNTGYGAQPQPTFNYPASDQGYGALQLSNHPGAYLHHGSDAAAVAAAAAAAAAAGQQQHQGVAGMLGGEGGGGAAWQQAQHQGQHQHQQQQGQGQQQPGQGQGGSSTEGDGRHGAGLRLRIS